MPYERTNFTIQQIEMQVSAILADSIYFIKKDGLDNYRGIIRFLARDALEDVKEYTKYNKWYQSFIRRGILNQLNNWTMPQIQYYNWELKNAIANKWVDKP